jgi:hypothetical protein
MRASNPVDLPRIGAAHCCQQHLIPKRNIFRQIGCKKKRAFGSSASH